MAGTYTQSRTLSPFGNLSATTKTYTGDGTVMFRSLTDFKCQQVTTSFRTGKGESLLSPSELSDSNNYFNNLLQTKEVTYDTGHAFSTVKHEAFVNFPMFTQLRNYDQYSYHMPFVSNSMVVGVTYPVIPKWATADADGNKAILKTYPTKPGVSLAQTIAELKREGLPSVVGHQFATMKGSASRAIGGEFLNLVFGWTPLISDLDKLLKSVVSSSKTIQQMRRDSGRLVRRKYHFPTKQELLTSSVSQAQAWAGPDTGSPTYAQSGTLITEEVRTTEMWFSGAYTYYLDPGDDLVGKAIMYEQLANKLLGLRITPETLWELAPWSWLADWYANIGNNISVASAFQSDGLVLKYGYLMRKVTSTKMYTFIPETGSNPRFRASSLILKTTSKERVRSSPYGFGLATDQFTDRQWSILGALGLTKAPKALH